jgi:hypothetical protein
VAGDPRVELLCEVQVFTQGRGKYTPGRWQDVILREVGAPRPGGAPTPSADDVLNELALAAYIDLMDFVVERRNREVAEAETARAETMALADERVPGSGVAWSGSGRRHWSRRGRLLDPAHLRASGRKSFVQDLDLPPLIG